MAFRGMGRLWLQCGNVAQAKAPEPKQAQACGVAPCGEAGSLLDRVGCSVRYGMDGSVNQTRPQVKASRGLKWVPSLPRRRPCDPIGLGVYGVQDSKTNVKREKMVSTTVPGGPGSGFVGRGKSFSRLLSLGLDCGMLRP